MPVPPKDPDFFDKTNYVIDAWTQPCDAPWFIYIETMKPAALKAFITLLTFGWDDVARGFFRPRGLYQRRTGKRKGKWRRAIPRFPEIGEEIGKRLPGADEVKGKKWGCLVNSMWRIDSKLQQGLFWWLVADVTNDFAFEWTSLLYETVWCQASDLGRFAWHNTGTGAIPGGVWKLFGAFTKDYQEAPPTWVGTRGQTGSLPCTVAAASDIETRPPFNPPTSFRIVIWNRDTDEPFRDFDPCQLEAPGDGSACAMATVPPNTNFDVRMFMDGTNFANTLNGIVTASEIRQ